MVYAAVGKHPAAVKHAHYLARLGKKVLICQPSIFLINQTVNDLASLTPEVRFRAIHGETSDQVIADIIDHPKHTASGGEILLITHSALMLLPYFHRRQDWHIIVDEIPQADWCSEFSVPETHRLITDGFTIDSEAQSLADNRYIRAVPRDRFSLGADGTEQELRSGMGHLPAVRQYADLTALVILCPGRPVYQPY